MKKEGKKGGKFSGIMSFFILCTFLFCFNLGFASAGLSSKITGAINGYSSIVYLKTNSAATTGVDAYDMIAPDMPSNYSQFYSSVSSQKLSIDTWDSNPRTVSLVYVISSAQTGTITFSWSSLSGSDYDGTFTYYGDDSTYSNAVGSADMRSSTSYSGTLNADTKVYAKIAFANHVTSTQGDSSTSSSGGGGGGGGVVAAKPVEGISVDTKRVEMNMVVNSNKSRIITVKNNGKEQQTIQITSVNLNNMVIIPEKSFVLAPGESKDVKITFVAPNQTGVYTGKIYIAGQEVLVSLNSRSKELLFDAMIVVPDDKKTIYFGNNLDAQITLIPMGEDSRVDVTIHYIIKDYDGNTYLEESDTVLVDKQKDFSKQFSTKNLPTGNYVVALELIYPNGVATSSSYFEVAKKSALSMKTILRILIAGIAVLAVLVVFFMIRYIKRRKKFLSRIRKR